MSFIPRHNPPEDSEALDARELDALMAENYSVWPGRRREAITERCEQAEDVWEGNAENPSFDDVWPNMAYGHSGYSTYQSEDRQGMQEHYAGRAE